MLFLCFFCMFIALITVISSVSSSLNSDDLSAADLITEIITLITFSKTSNLWALDDILTISSAYADSFNSSDDCFNTLSVQMQNSVITLKEYLSYNELCSSTQEEQLKTAAWDVSILTNYTSNWSVNACDIAADIFYVSSDYLTQQQRISDKWCLCSVMHQKLHELFSSADATVVQNTDWLIQFFRQLQLHCCLQNHR